MTPSRLQSWHCFLASGFVLLSPCCSEFHAQSQQAQSLQTQTVRLEPGWNLIAFQAVPSNASPATVFNTNLFKAVWTYENGTGRWLRYGRVESSSGDNQVSPLQSIELGHAYWAYYDRPSPTNWSVTGLVPSSGFSLSFKQGWNLVSVPADAASADVNIVSIFRPGDLNKIQFIARWEAANQRMQVYEPRNASASEFQIFNPNLGHWVRATEQLSIQPDMVVEATGDADLLPLRDPPVADGRPWTPGPEDIDVGLPGDPPVFNTRATQTAIKIAKGQPSLLLPLYNRGGGILAWTARLLARGSQGGAIGLGASEVSHVFSLQQASGITSSETDTLKIVVDRTHLSSGTYLARLEISSSTGQRKTFDVIVDVGGLDGQWEGTASIQTVNSKANTVADIDLVIHLFHDNKVGSSQLRGFIDSRETLLWPMDAQLLGHITDAAPGAFDPNYASRFVISGGFTMPPGDVNRHPFESFPTNNGVGVTINTNEETGLEFLSNAEGDRWYHTLPDRVTKPNFLNPFPKFISREVELIGQLTGSEEGAAVATGDYYETITGMMPQPINLRGTFRLVRKNYSPLEKRPYKYFDLAIPQGGLSVGAGNSALRTNIFVPDHILIKRLVVVVAQDAESDEHTMVLTGPNGVSVTLHDGQQAGSTKSVIYDSGELPIDPLRLLDPPDLRGNNEPNVATTGNLSVENRLRESLANYSIRRPRGTNSDGTVSDLRTFDDLDAFGTWTLRYQNIDAGTTHKLFGWSLLAFGAPAHPIAGRVEVEGNTNPNRFQDVSVQVLGLNVDLDAGLIDFDRNTGRFTLPCLPVLRVNVIASKPGYLPGTIEGLNTPSDPRHFRDGLGGILIGGPGTTNLILTLRLPSTTSPPQIFTHLRNFTLTGVAGTTRLSGATAEFLGSTPEDQICWELQWLGANAPLPQPGVVGRNPTFELDIPTSQFNTNNQFTLAFRPVARLCSSGLPLSTGEWATVTLSNPAPPPNANPYWNTILVQGTILQGFGAVEGSVTDGVDVTGRTALHAQKTDVGKVDVDRPPYIDPSMNPTFQFQQDGLSGDSDGEDTDLHPRNFAIYAPGTRQNEYAYAEILEVSDLRFAKLEPPQQGQTPTYDDLSKNIDGRDINMPGEPVRIFTAIGGRICNLGVSSSDGVFRVSAGANPGIDYRPAVLTASFAANRIRIVLDGVPGFKYGLQTSTDLINWEVVHSGRAPFIYEASTLGPPAQRYYRGVESP